MFIEIQFYDLNCSEFRKGLSQGNLNIFIKFKVPNFGKYAKRASSATP